MERKELTLPEIQQEMLKVAIKIDEICEKIGIRYCLAYGSLIGAIRHKGFIPWDDDLDIWMSKRDLGEFSKFCDTHIEELKPYKLCNRANTKNYSYNIPRFTNLDYEYINTDPHQAQFDIGVFVDIYPIEGYGNSLEEAKRIQCKCDRLNMLYDIYINPNSKNGIVKDIIKKMISPVLHKIYGDKYYYIQEKKFDEYLKKYSDLNCRYVGKVRWPGWFKPFEKNDVFDEHGEFNVVKHSFENVELYIPVHYDSILINIYGDYMKLPPQYQRHPHHEYQIFRRLKK